MTNAGREQRVSGTGAGRRARCASPRGSGSPRGLGGRRHPLLRVRAPRTLCARPGPVRSPPKPPGTACAPPARPPPPPPPVPPAGGGCSWPPVAPRREEERACAAPGGRAQPAPRYTTARRHRALSQVPPRSAGSPPAAAFAPCPCPTRVPPSPGHVPRGKRQPGAGGDPRCRRGSAQRSGMALRAAPGRASCQTVRAGRRGEGKGRKGGSCPLWGGGPAA